MSDDRAGEWTAAAARLAGMAGAVLGWSPDAFWRATPAQLACVVRALAGGERVAAPPDAATIARLREAPGDCVAIAGERGGWRVTDIAVEHYVVTLTLTPLASTPLAATATSGAVVGAADMAIGATILAAFETPALDDAVLAAPRLTVAATGGGVGWRRAALLVSTDGGASWTAAGGAAAPATIGALVTVPAAAPSTLFDLVGTIDVDLVRADLVLADADDGRLDGGANLAIAGEELIQFGRAEPLGGARWRLSRLLRGRRGTEAAGTQAVGDRFVLLEDDSLRTIDLPLATLGGEVRVMASGVGDTAGPVEAVVTVTGRSVLPPSPAHLTAAVAADGAAAVGWVRRSRAGWRWIDGVDAPLAEESEAYRVAVATADGAHREVDGGEPAIAITAAERAAGPVTVAVSQRGTQGLSPTTIMRI